MNFSKQLCILKDITKEDRMNLRKLFQQTSILAVVLILSHQGLSAELKPTEWREDIDYLVHFVDSVHPNPYTQISQEEFDDQVSRIKSNLDRMDDFKIATELMELVASIRDGHTSLMPTNVDGFNKWFPVRFYRFTDGIFITAIGAEYGEYAGSQVLKIGETDVMDAHALISPLKSSDNLLGEMESIFYLSSPKSLEAKGIIDDSKQLPLTIVTPSGEKRTIVLPSVAVKSFDLNWSQWGEMYGPAPLEIKYVTAFEGRSPFDFRKGDTTLPYHLRFRRPYYFTEIAEKNAIYMQFNFVLDFGDESFREFYLRMFDYMDKNEIGMFILDARYNSGGNGDMLMPFVHEFIKRDYINSPGKLFTLVGRKTFSASVMLIDAMKDHTKSYFIGEPASAPLNMYGDATFGQSFLPNSGMRLQVSTLYWQLSRWDDHSREIPVDLPAQFSSDDYFSGRDPALDKIFADEGFLSISDLFLERGAEEAMAQYRIRKEKYGHLPWWSGFSERELNNTAYILLADGRTSDAVAAFGLNSEVFPESWNVWDSFGEALLVLEDTAASVESYRKSLELNSGNSNATMMLNRIQVE